MTAGSRNSEAAPGRHAAPASKVTKRLRPRCAARSVDDARLGTYRAALRRASIASGSSTGRDRRRRSLMLTAPAREPLTKAPHPTRHTLSMFVPPGYPIGSPQVMA